MPKDYKKPEKHTGSRKGSMLLGIMIGLVLGLALALAVAWYINKMPNPFSAKPAPPIPKADAPAKSATAPKSADAPSKATDKAGDKVADKDKSRFDFYTVLPGKEEPATDQQMKDAQKSTAGGKEAFYLQAGAFQNAPDADNLKARLALMGIEASIQTTTLPEKGVWHRVRVGPYTDVEEVNRSRNTLKQNGVDTTLIKVRESGK